MPMMALMMPVLVSLFGLVLVFLAPFFFTDALMMLLSAFVTTFLAMVLTAFLMMLLAMMSVAALLAAVLAAAACPRDYFHFTHWLIRIVARDDQFARMRLSLRGLVANDELQTGSGVQGGRKRIVDQAPMSTLVFEGHLGHVQVAVTDITYLNTSEYVMMALHTAEICRPGNG